MRSPRHVALALPLVVVLLVVGLGMPGPAGSVRPVEAAGRRTPTPTTTPTPTPSPTPNPAGSWRIAALPNTAPNQTSLNGVAAISPSDAWAVGSVGAQTFIEHWNGSSWVTVPSPNVTGPNFTNGLNAVAAIASNDVWAVGFTTNPHASPSWSTLTLHWDGTQWTIVPSPSLTSPVSYNDLLAVSAVASNDVWAVGGSPGGGLGTALFLHWNGATWGLVAPPAESSLWSSSTRRGVAAIASNDAWSVGDGLAMHWDGTQWSVGGGANGLAGVAAVGSNDVWSVGSFTYSDGYYTYGPFTDAYHWNGASWGPATTVSPTGDDRFVGVGAISSGDVWAVGASGPGTLTENWNGTSWGVFASPNPATNTYAENVLTSVAGSSASDVWAVGYYVDSSLVQQAVIEHFSKP
jgi:hypothetical protein